MSTGKQVFLSLSVIEKLDKIRKADNLSYSQAIEKLFRKAKSELRIANMNNRIGV